MEMEMVERRRRSTRSQAQAMMGTEKEEWVAADEVLDIHTYGPRIHGRAPTLTRGRATPGQARETTICSGSELYARYVSARWPMPGV